MGNQVTVDKHTTQLEEWLDLKDKLDSTTFQQEPCPHIGAWKLFPDEINQTQTNCLPVEIDLTNVHQLLSPHHSYLVYTIRNNQQTVPKVHLAAISSLILSIQQHIDPASYQTPITSGTISHYDYCVYAYLGKLSKPKVKLMTLSYALKMQGLLNSHKKLAILSAGGVLRSKKLQKGSTISFLNNAPAINKQISQNPDIHAFTFFWRQPNTTNPLLSFKSKRVSPFIECEAPSPKAATGGVKPPMLKLSLKPFEQVSYSQIQQQQKNGQIKFDIRATARHQLKMQKFSSQCNQIIDGIFVSGEKAARSLQILQQHQIKYIINCAGDYCQNWHETKGITYLTFFLKDAQTQNIECLFYRAIEFIQQCQKQKQNVLVHCIQGISRSVTIVIAYLIFKLGYDYKKAEQYVKQRRGIACPNNGFMVELIQFHKRLYEDYLSLPSPRVFLVSSHSKETPSLITARMIKQPLFDSRRYLGLDCRGIYIVQVPQIVYIWVGNKCQEKRLQMYWSYAQEYVKKLQKYERASIKLKAISQGTEGKQFFALWNIDSIPLNYENPEYTRLFTEGQTSKTGGMRKYYEREIQQENQVKLFIHPDSSQGLGVFEFDDLAELNILVSQQSDSLKIYVIRDESVEEDKEQIGSFLDAVIRKHYQSVDPGNIMIEEEFIGSPSQELMDFFA